MSDLEDLERTIRDRLDAIGRAPRAVLLHVLMLPDHSRAIRIGEPWMSADRSMLRKT